MLRLTRMMFQVRLGVRKDVYSALGGEALAVLLGIAGPYLLKLLVDQITVQPMASAKLMSLILLFALATALAGMVATVRHYASTQIVEALSADITEKLLAARLPELAKGGDESEARLFGQIERLPFTLHLMIDGLLWQVVPLCIQIVLALGFILAVVPRLYAIMIGLILISYFFIAVTGTRRYQRQAEAANTKAMVCSAFVADILRNARRVVFNGNIQSELETSSALASERRALVIHGARSLVVMALMQSAIVLSGLALLLGLAARDVMAGRLTAGDLILVQAFTLRLILPLGGVGFLLQHVARATAHMRDIFWLIDQGKPAFRPFAAMAQGAGNLDLSDVTFRFGRGTDVLRNVTISISAGMLVTIVGANGAGKSTLARIMGGLLVPSNGQVRMNGADLADMPFDQRHRHVLYVPQHLGLFARSLRENGLYPPTVLTEEDLRSLLRMIHFHADGRVLDLDLIVGEGGQGLSGGQMQKLELARLAGVEVPIIILDEATSALDPASEAAAINMLRRARSNTTLILVNHRREIAQQADIVLFMADGKLICSGSDAALARRQDYRDFWGREQG